MGKATGEALDVPREMKPYFLTLLVHGQRWSRPESAEAKQLLSRHLSFNRQMIEQKKFALAGPVFASERVVGLAVVAAETAEQARAIASQDPEVVAGRLAVEVYPTMLPSLDEVRIKF